MFLCTFSGPHYDPLYDPHSFPSPTLVITSKSSLSSSNSSYSTSVQHPLLNSNSLHCNIHDKLWVWCSNHLTGSVRLVLFVCLPSLFLILLRSVSMVSSSTPRQCTALTLDGEWHHASFAAKIHAFVTFLHQDALLTPDMWQESAMALNIILDNLHLGITERGLDVNAHRSLTLT